MKITFLGTGAADWPLEKPSNATEFRRLSSVLIDDILLIDPGPQIINALFDLNKDPKQIKYIINTHKHSDHFCTETIEYLESHGAVFHSFSNNEEKNIGSYTIRSYQGNHSTCENTVHFLITKNDSTLFYGLDGAWLLYEEIQAIQKHQPSFAVLDATIGFVDGDYRIFEHNNLHMVLEMKKSLNPYVKTFCISHMAKTLHTSHYVLSDSMKKHDILVAYDGLEVEF